MKNKYQKWMNKQDFKTLVLVLLYIHIAFTLQSIIKKPDRNLLIHMKQLEFRCGDEERFQNTSGITKL